MGKADEVGQQYDTQPDPTANLEKRYASNLERTPKEARYKRISARYQAYIDQAWADFTEKRYIMAAHRFRAAGDLKPEEPEFLLGLFFTSFANEEVRMTVRNLNRLINEIDTDLSGVLNDIDVVGRYGNPQDLRDAAIDLDKVIILSTGDSSTNQAFRTLLAWYLGDKDDALRRARALRNSEEGKHWARLLYHLQKALNLDSDLSSVPDPAAPSSGGALELPAIPPPSTFD